MEIKSVEELGLPPIVHELAKKPRGFILVTGPTGSGKSTSLAAIIDEINQTRDEHILRTFGACSFGNWILSGIC